MTTDIIHSETDIKHGVTALRKKCPHMRAVHKVTGIPPLRREEGGFPGLAEIIVGQQLSIASADAIWARLQDAVSPMTTQKLSGLNDDKLRSCGLSAAKVRTLRAVCEAVSARTLDLDTLHTHPDELIHSELTKVKGIGPWTADIYIMFCVGRADGWAPGDLALKHAVRAVLEKDEIPSEQDMIVEAERWRPWRGVAARMLWAYYSTLKERRVTASK